MSKQRIMKILSWYLIISMIFEMLPTSFIAAALAESGNDAQPIMTVNDGTAETDAGGSGEQAGAAETIAVSGSSDSSVSDDGDGWSSFTSDETGRSQAQVWMFRRWNRLPGTVLSLRLTM